MNNGTFFGNLRDTSGDLYVKAPGYSSGTPPANKPYGLGNTNNATVQSQPVQKVSVKSTPNKTKVTKVYDDGGVDIQTTIKEADPYNLMNGNYGRAEYSYSHIPGKSLKRSVIGAYNGKYTLSEAKAVMDKDMLRNIYYNVGATLEYDDNQKAAITNLIDTYLDSKYGGQKAEPEAKTPVTPEVKETATSENEGDTDKDTVTFSITQDGKGFGQRILDLGLATDKGLWGADGDVAYYTRQLYDQGALDSRGNLRTGVPIKLKKRKI